MPQKIKNLSLLSQWFGHEREIQVSQSMVRNTTLLCLGTTKKLPVNCSVFASPQNFHQLLLIWEKHIWSSFQNWYHVFQKVQCSSTFCSRIKKPCRIDDRCHSHFCKVMSHLNMSCDYTQSELLSVTDQLICMNYSTVLQTEMSKEMRWQCTKINFLLLRSFTLEIAHSHLSGIWL